MGQKRKKTNIIDSTEIKKVSKKFVRGHGPDLKSIQDKKLKRELIGIFDKILTRVLIYCRINSCNLVAEDNIYDVTSIL